jgi:hypothetical protein
MTEPRTLASALCEQAKTASIPHGTPGGYNYPFALGYLTGTLEQALRYLTPAQRQEIARTYLTP